MHCGHASTNRDVVGGQQKRACSPTWRADRGIEDAHRRQVSLRRTRGVFLYRPVDAATEGGSTPAEHARHVSALVPGPSARSPRSSAGAWTISTLAAFLRWGRTIGGLAAFLCWGLTIGWLAAFLRWGWTMGTAA